MPRSHADQAFVAYVVDLMQALGPVRARRMFGGHGIFLDDLMFALVAEGVLYLKVDAATREAYLARGLEAFVYYKQGKPVTLSYAQAPEEVLEDVDAMRAWAGAAFQVARRGAVAR